MYGVTFKMTENDLSKHYAFATSQEAQAYVDELISKNAWYVHTSHSQRYGSKTLRLNGQDVSKVYA